MMMSQQDNFDRGRRLGDEIETTMEAKFVIARKGNFWGFFSVDRLLEPAVRCGAAGTVQGGTGDEQCALIQDRLVAKSKSKSKEGSKVFSTLIWMAEYITPQSKRILFWYLS